MTIKKTIKKTVIKTGGAAANGAAAAPATGGATIADRYKLAPAAPVKSGPSGKGLVFAFIAACLAFLVSGILVFILYQHWEFLMPA